MKKAFSSTWLSFAAGLTLAGVSAPTHAHVSLPPGGATAGTAYEAAFQVGHACAGANATTGITVRLPEGFTYRSAESRPGWTLKTSAREVSWSADSAANALPGSSRAEFIVRGELPARAATLWFKVLQSCGSASADWAQIPDAGHAKPAFPAARLDVLPAGSAPLDVQDAWARPAVPGQSGTGAYMRLMAPSGGRLVGASSPVAGVAEVHEMSMDGNIMRMRPVKGGLALPARQSVALGPGGYHLMLTELKQPLAAGSTIDLTLQFVDAQGRRSSRTVKATVGNGPAGAPAPAAEEHKGH